MLRRGLEGEKSSHVLATWFPRHGRTAGEVCKARAGSKDGSPALSNLCPRLSPREENVESATLVGRFSGTGVGRGTKEVRLGSTGWGEVGWRAGVRDRGFGSRDIGKERREYAPHSESLNYTKSGLRNLHNFRSNIRTASREGASVHAALPDNRMMCLKKYIEENCDSYRVCGFL